MMQLRSFVNICERCVHSYKLKGYFKEATSKFKPQKKKKDPQVTTQLFYMHVYKSDNFKNQENYCLLSRESYWVTLCLLLYSSCVICYGIID